MASKRKSTVPCMIPAKSKHLREEIVLGCLPELLPTIPEDSILSISGHEKEETQKTSSMYERGTHRCPPCSFQTTDLNLFLKHMDSCHVEFYTQPSFYCLNCKVFLAKFDGLTLHNAKTHPELQMKWSPGKASLQVTKRDGVLIVEQILFTEKEDFSETGISITKTPIMKMMVKGEHKKIVVSHTVEVQRAAISPEKPTTVANGTAGRSIPTPQTLTGAVSLPVPKIPNPGIPVTQNMKPLWNSASSSSDLNRNLPKVMIPLSSIPTYDPAMDLSSFLKASFGKFPYPTKAELCYLTVVSGFPEEQIKLWFTAQRLKQGISWSPEEIEDTRRRMFNTVFQAAPIALQGQSHQQVPQPFISSQPASASTAFIPHSPKGNVMGRKGGVIVTQTGMTQGSSLKHQAVVQTPQVNVRHGIITRDTRNGLLSQKDESSALSQASVTGNHAHGEKTEAGSSSSGKAGATGITSSSQKQNSCCSEGSIMNLTNIVRKIDCNVNNTSCTSKPNTSSAFLYGQEKATGDTKESSHIATSSKSNNGGNYESTSHSTICTKKEINISDHTSKAKNIDSSVICSSTGAGELVIRTGSLSKSKSKLPEQLEDLKQSIILSSFPEQKLIATRDTPVWEAEKPCHSHSSADSHLALGLFLGNVLQTSNDAHFQEDNQFSFKSLLAKPEKLSPNSSLGAPQVPYTDFTAIHYKDHDPPALEDHPQTYMALVDRSRISSKIIQREADNKYLEQQKSQTNNTFYNTDKGEQCRKVHLQYASQKDEGKKIAAIEEMPSLQKYTEEEEDQWQGIDSYCEPKTESIKINSKTLNETEHMAETSRKQINNQQLDEDSCSSENGPLKERESHQHIPAKEHFVKDDICIKENSQKPDDQTRELETEQGKAECLRPERQSIFHSLDTQIPVRAKKNPEGIKETSEKSLAKDHWLMKDEEPQQDNQSRDCVRGELLKV